MGLLRTKLYRPVPPTNTIPRPRLQRRLLDALNQHSLTVVSAPAGYGKTTLIATAAAEPPQPLAWLSLDPGDDEPSRFWRYLIAALRTVDDSLGDQAVEALAGPTPPPAPALLTLLLNDLSRRSAPVWLVLDDYHHIDTPAIHQGMTFLVDHAPPSLRVLLLTRVDPPLPVHRWRADERVTELRANELRFSPTECAAFLRRRLGDDALSDGQVELLHKQTEGWPVGLRLAALSLRHHPDRAGFLRDFAGTNRYVLEYLTEEVLRHQPEEIRAFLLRTAPLQQLTAPLCDALRRAADSAALLEYLEENNLFLVPLDERGEWYRYHHLFAELLRGMLRRQWPAEIPALHRRAARWYAEQDRPEAAIDHALAAGDDLYAARLLDKHAPVAILRGESRAVARWLERLPPARRSMAPRAVLAYGWTLLLHGDYAGVAAQIAEANQVLDQDDRPRRGELSALRAGLAGVQGNAAAALNHAREAIRQAPAENRLVQAHAHFALAGAYRTLGDQAAAIGAYEQALPLCRAADMRLPEMLSRSHLAYLYRLRGQLSRAEAICRPVLDEKLEHPAMGGVFSNLGAVCLERAQVTRAEQLLRRGLQLSSRGEHPASLALPHAYLARLHLARGDNDGAGAALSAAAVHMADGVPAWVIPEVVGQQVAFWLAQGDVTLADQALAGAEPAGDHIAEQLDLARVRILLQRRDWRAADTLLAAVEDSAQKGDRVGQLLTIHILRAQLRHAQGAERRARDAVRRALTLAEPEGFVLHFVEGGEAVARLLAGVATPFARQILEAFPAAVRETAAGAATPMEPLTGRELEVLRLMAHGHTYRQIADRLVISVNTVRTHVKNIYGKLGVNKRTLALARARDLRLLDE